MSEWNLIKCVCGQGYSMESKNCWRCGTPTPQSDGGMSDDKPQLTDAMLKDFVQSFPKPRFIGTCKDCKWWKPIDGFNRVPSMLICEILTAQMQEDDTLNNPQAERDEFILHQCRDGGPVQTADNFGCIHWEAKQ